MGRFLCIVILAATLLLNHSAFATRRGGRRGKGNWRKYHGHWNCFPNEATKARCFADYPNAGHTTRSWLAKFMPSPEEDSYVFNGSTSFDTEDFTVRRIEEDPKFICQTKDAFVKSLHCLSDSVKTKCPSLPDRMTGFYIDFAEGLTYVCSRLHEMDSVCLHTHFNSMRSCKREAYSKMKKDFDQVASHHHGHKAGRHSSRGGKGFSRPGSNNGTSRGFNRPGRMSGSYNSTSNGTDSAGMSGRKSWWRGPRRNANVTADNSTTADQGLSDWEMVRCRFKYVMLQCQKEKTEDCHADTAQIMYEFMKNMYSPECQAKMAEWEEAHVLDHVTDCHDDQCGAAWRLSAPWQGLLLCLLLVFLVVTRFQ